VAILDSAGSNINIDGNVTSFTDFGGVDTYTILASLSADVTITDNNASVINLPEGLDVSAVSFLSDGMQITVNGNTVTLLGNPAAFSFVFGGTPLDTGAGTLLDYQATAAAFGATVPPSGSGPNGASNVGLVNADGSVGNGTGGTLPTVSLAPTNGQTTEGDSGNTVVTFTTTLSEASSELVAVDYATSSSSAQSGLDFLAASGLLEFAPGTTQQTFDVEIVGDTAFEQDETFEISLSNPQGAELDQSAGFAALHTISNDDPIQFGLVLKGVETYEGVGGSVAAAGDINGDGIDDILIGAEGFGEFSPGSNIAGRAYVVFGRDPASHVQFPVSISLGNLNGGDGFVLNGANGGDRFGKSISTAGDVNGDGLDDILISAQGADPFGSNLAGETYVIFGQSSPFSSSVDLFDPLTRLWTLNSSDGFLMRGVDAFDSSGSSVSSAGDVNGDEIDDIIVSATGAAPGGVLGAGETYVVFGRNTASDGAFPSSFNFAQLDAASGITLSGENLNDLAGATVSTAGDFNNDGIGDFLISSANADPSGLNGAGKTYVIFGRNYVDGPFPAEIQLATLDGTDGFVLNGIDEGDRSAAGPGSSAGDFNGDDISDIIISAPSANPDGVIDAGETYVVFGRDTAVGGNFDASISLANLDGTNGFVLNGIDGGDRSGSSVSSAGDVNGDGIADILILASGEIYLVFGMNSETDGNFAASINLETLDGTNGFVLEISGSSFNTSVSSAGDVNGDGLDDILIGNSGIDVDGLEAAGQVYVVFGGETVLAEFDGADGSADGRIELDLLLPTDQPNQAIKGLDKSVEVLGTNAIALELF